MVFFSFSFFFLFSVVVKGSHCSFMISFIVISGFLITDEAMRFASIDRSSQTRGKEKPSFQNYK